MVNVVVRYFAVLREQRGLDSENVATDSATLRALYIDLADRHGFRLPVGVVRYAVNGTFVDQDRPLTDGDEVVFVPPVAGG